jgi:hypothetical protein
MRLERGWVGLPATKAAGEWGREAGKVRAVKPPGRNRTGLSAGEMSEKYKKLFDPLDVYP